jgi:hypothetical protein
MTEIANRERLSSEHNRALENAVYALEKNSLVGNISEFTSKPVEELLLKVPKPIRKQVENSVERLTFKCLDLAINSLDLKTVSNHQKFDTLYTRIAGGLGGIFGIGSLPIELPVTTTLLLRSIAAIARNQGEDFSQLDSRLACVEVFALSRSVKKDPSTLTYYASRAMLSKLSNDAIRVMSERSIAEVSGAEMGSIAAQTATKYTTIVSEKVLAGAIPILGAIGGATVNIIFLNYFKNLAHGHFTIRKLERIYGAEEVKSEFYLKLEEFKKLEA